MQPTIPSGFRNNAFRPQLVAYDVGGRVVTVGYRIDRYGRSPELVEVDGVGMPVESATAGGEGVSLTTAGLTRAYLVDQVGATTYVDGPDGSSALVERDRFPRPDERVSEGSALAPMPGTVVRVAVAKADVVRAGQVLVVLEAMKMEHAVHATSAGTVVEVDVSEGDQVETGRVLAIVEPGAAEPEAAGPEATGLGAAGPEPEGQGGGGG